MDKLGAFMQTKHLCVVFHIWTKGDVGALKSFKPSSKLFLLIMLLLWIICSIYNLCLSCVCV